jgi:uncharacterized protein YoxC
MGSAAEVLIIILAIVLSIFLIVGIILGIYLIRVSAEIRKITKSAQKAVDAAENAVQGFVKWSSPVMAAKTVLAFAKNFKKGGVTKRRGRK